MDLSKAVIVNNALLFFLIFSVKAQHINESLSISKRSLEVHEPHFFESYGECNREFLSKFSDVLMKVICKPRPMAVEIVPKSTNLLVVPSKVLVNRCDGMCHAKQSCLATEKKVLKVMVQQMDLLEENPMPECGVVHVEEHIRCKCKCTVMEEHCNEKQKYQAGECMCLCMNADERDKCIHEGKSWNDEKCSCMCPEQRECTTPLVWLPQYCRCAKLMNEDEMNEDDASLK